MAVARKLPPGSELHRKFSPEAAPAAERVILIGDDSKESEVEMESVLTPLLLEVPTMSTAEEGERVLHLVQQEDLIAHIHNEELPPDSYYEELQKHSSAKFPESSPHAREHA